MVFRCLYSSPEKPSQIVPPFLCGKCPLAPDLPFAQRSLVQRGFQFINIRPDLFPKIIALNMFGSAFPNALRPHRADIAIRLFRIVNPPQPSGQPSKIPQLQFFLLRAAIQIVFLIVDKGRGIAFSHRPLVSLSRAAHKIEYCGLSVHGGTREDHRRNPLWLLEWGEYPDGYVQSGSNKEPHHLLPRRSPLCPK